MPRGWKVALVGVDTLEGAQALMGAKVFGERARLPETASGEYYLADLQGAEAVDADTGLTIGRCVGTESTLGPDRWWFEGERGKFAVPATKRYVVSVDTANRRILLRNVKELLE